MTHKWVVLSQEQDAQSRRLDELQLTVDLMYLQLARLVQTVATLQAAYEQHVKSSCTNCTPMPEFEA